MITMLFGAFLLIVIVNAWVSDDAYITFRTVDNFINGYGLRWNISERVQVYTHPLWMFVVAGVYAATHEIYFTALALSIVISAIAVMLMALRGARSSVMAMLVLALATLSKASVDYATSGLENPLTHLLLVGFMLLYTRRQKRNARSIFWLSLLMGLGLVNRLDTALLFAPAMAWAVIEAYRETHDWKVVGAAALGALPVVLWELFAIFYYGSPFPNTALAKLNSGLIPRAKLWSSGLTYLHNSLQVDPITLVTIAISIAVPVVARDWRKVPLSLGTVLYLAYIVRIGGDFMSGRFLSAPWFVATFVLASTAWTTYRVPQIALSLVLILVGLSAPYNPIRASGGERAHTDEDIWLWGKGITDERANYYVNTGLVRALIGGRELPDHDWANSGREARGEEDKVSVRGSVGFYGFFAGPEVHVIDILGLGDPLLARLPVADPSWRVGHYGRRPPDGYEETVKTGENHIADPDLAAYYDKLSYVIQGDLWAVDRWLEVWRLNTGHYDALLDAYAYRRTDNLTTQFLVTNVSGHPYVYAYVWNNDAGEVYRLDSDSEEGTTYVVSWSISRSGVEFYGDYKEKVSSIGIISDQALINVGVIFSYVTDFSEHEMYERRYWFRFEEDGRMTVVMPPLEWHNADGPGGYWEEMDIDSIMAPVP
jgi:arabinofuranosyltransferase